MKKVLVLGAGLVTRPHVRYLLDVPDFEVTVASRTVSKAEALIDGHPRGRAIALDVTDEAAMEDLIRQSDLAVSMLPYVYHPKVAALCVKHGKHMVTTSYVKDEMLALDGPAKEAGVILLNEIGVDPGIDHMSAMKVIHEVEGKGGKIVSFVSWTGGLPGPRSQRQSLWLQVLLEPARVCCWRARIRPASKGMAKSSRYPARNCSTTTGQCTLKAWASLRVIPTATACPMPEIYGIQPTDWMFRGTLRNVGWCATLKKIAEMGFLDDSPFAEPPATFRELTARLLDVSPDTDFPQYLAEQWGMCDDSKPITDLDWLGLFSDEPLPEGKNTRLDVLAARMEAKTGLQAGRA